MSDGAESDMLPVPAGQPRITRPAADPGELDAGRRTAPAVIPAVQAAAAAAGGFVAGAAVVGLVHRRSRTRALARAGGRRPRAVSRRSGRSGRQAVELLQIVGSRSLLLDVHLLGGTGADR